MKISHIVSIFAVCLVSPVTQVQGQVVTYTNFIRQVQLPENPPFTTEIAVNVDPVGNMDSKWAVNETGARFELHTVSSDLTDSILLDSRNVGSFYPVAEITIVTQDPDSFVPRTRVDIPFEVVVELEGLAEIAAGSDAAAHVRFYHHAQAYGPGGSNEDIDPDNATLVSQELKGFEGTETVVYTPSPLLAESGSISKSRGEERFSIYSLEYYKAPVARLASATVQIWPEADGTISGISKNGAVIEFTTPPITLAANDLYPGSKVQAQVYKGVKRDGVVGTVIPGSGFTGSDTKAWDFLETIEKWDSVISENGTWTMELITITPFDVVRLDYVTFDVDRTISVRGNVTTIE